jgi:hypothetical protein
MLNGDEHRRMEILRQAAEEQRKQRHDERFRKQRATIGWLQASRWENLVRSYEERR